MRPGKNCHVPSSQSRYAYRIGSPWKMNRETRVATFCGSEKGQSALMGLRVDPLRAPGEACRVRKKRVVVGWENWLSVQRDEVALAGRTAGVEAGRNFPRAI